MAFAAWGFFGGILSGLVFGCIGVLPFWVLPRGRRERYTMVAARAWARFVVRWVLFARVHVQGDLSLTPGEGALLVCNHRSWLDPLMLIGWTGSNGLSKKAIFFVPVIGLFGWLAGAVYFDRRSRADRARAREEVIFLAKRGHRIQIFPEATRSRDGKLRTRVFLAMVRDAYRAGIPVVPCAVEHTERTLPPETGTAHPFKDVYLYLGEVMRTEEFESEQDYAIESWRRVKALLGEA